MIRFGAVSLENEVVYSNSGCRLKINNGNEERGDLVLTNRFANFCLPFFEFFELFLLFEGEFRR
jgi:hypothetical protein